MNKELELALDPIRGQVINISRMLPTGAKFYTIEAKDVDQQFEKKKNAIMANPLSPEFITNRSPRVIHVKDHSVVTQQFKVSAGMDGKVNNVVVFNPDTDDSAQATVIAGDVTFGQATDEAMKDALQGQNRIFADGVKICTKANQVNQAELDRVMEQIRYWQSIKDSLQSAISSNTKKVQDYLSQIEKNKQPVEMSGEGSSVTVIV
jgi:hypothetical protein